MIRYQIQLFAGARESVGQSLIGVHSPENITAGELQGLIGQQWPVIASLTLRSRLAVNDQYVAPDHPLTMDDEIALIPPVSGG